MPTSANGAEPGIWRRLWRALILRCPSCRHGPIFYSGWDMFDNCPNCDLLLNREPGYYVGSMEVNVAVTFTVAMGTYFLLAAVTSWPHVWTVTLACAIGGIFPILFYRHARSLWICLDRIFDPHDHWWEPRDR